MASNAMYGKEMTWGTLDVLGQVYDAYYLPDSYESMSNYKYEDENAKTLIDGMWSKTYNAIANSNNLLSRIGSEDPSKFSGGEMEKNTIEGEALALRALLICCDYLLQQKKRPTQLTSPISRNTHPRTNRIYLLVNSWKR